MKDVHTEHCCETHGCKYGDPACTVATGKKKASFKCEDCTTPTNEEKLATLIKEIERVLPYVTATIAPNNGYEVTGLIGFQPTKVSEGTTDWKAIHKGRASSSYRQLNNLLKLAQSMKV